MDAETQTPDFLPKKPHSWEQLRVAVRNNLDATLGLVTPLPIQELGLTQLEIVEPGSYTLTAIQHDGVFQADIHSHPGDDPGSEQPSRDDISKLSATIDGKNYIISQKGLIEFQKPQNLPGGFTSVHDAEKAWQHWITKELRLNEEEFNKRGGWELKKEFYTKFFGLRTISWENQDEIERLLVEKEALHIVERN